MTPTLLGFILVGAWTLGLLTGWALRNVRTVSQQQPVRFEAFPTSDALERSRILMERDAAQATLKSMLEVFEHRGRMLHKQGICTTGLCALPASHVGQVPHQDLEGHTWG